ncbi:YeeE/YedE family protein [Aquisediminimonas sediminicola]|uniref:YeeE/YedE family protein n=1 Tax=Alteraquisediminimonas sediminicola TaxID=2676787 RepID=UPI001C8DF14C|nr:YeeE/YedE thiosulfate transporter family protein [Aquisediminimonas sediminicola]
MEALFPQAEPLQGLIGGLLIGVAAAIMLLGLGRIAGVSGMTARATGIGGGATSRLVAAAFVIGLPLGAWIAAQCIGPMHIDFPSWPALISGGLLVGFGTRMGSGCTSGHGVCGISRLSRRSIVATMLFMASGFATVAIMRAIGLLGV